MAKGKTTEAITKLTSMQAPTAVLLTFSEEDLNAGHFDDGAVSEEETPIELLQKGDILKVVPGERVPTDGVVVWGHDESMITGESIPVHHALGDDVMEEQSTSKAYC